MFRKFFIIAAFAVGLLAVSAEKAAAQANTGADAGARVDRRIRHEILTLPYYGVFDAIGYQLNGDTVTLTGYVTRPTTKKDAEESIRDIDGVRNVVDKIEVLPPSPSDDRIRYRLLQTFVNRGGSLYRYFMGANPAIRIIVNHGRVDLEGYVDNRGDANLANILARSVPLTFGVTNNLKVINDVR